jgi:hypothetical protein
MDGGHFAGLGNGVSLLRSVGTGSVDQPASCRIRTRGVTGPEDDHLLIATAQTKNAWT